MALVLLLETKLLFLEWGGNALSCAFHQELQLCSGKARSRRIRAAAERRALSAARWERARKNSKIRRV